MKGLFKKYIPDPQQLKEQRFIRIFGRWLLDPNLFHLNRRSVSGGVLVGMICAFTPIFPQMLTSAGLSILFRVNMPIAVALVWLTNPVTIPPAFYVAYLFGLWMLGQDSSIGEFQMNFEWIMESLDHIWWPLLLGGFTIGVITGLIGFFLVRGLWRWHIVNQMRKRKIKRNGAQLSAINPSEM